MRFSQLAILRLTRAFRRWVRARLVLHCGPSITWIWYWNSKI